MTNVRPAPFGANVTAPAFVAPSLAAQATFSSWRCSRISRVPLTLDPGDLRDPAQPPVVELLDLLHAAHELGNSSNCVHWLYAMLTGTSTVMLFCTFVVISASWCGASVRRVDRLFLYPRSAG